MLDLVISVNGLPIITIELKDTFSQGVEWNIKKLKKEGEIKRIGPAKGGHWEVIK